ncbi:hypothetical protein FRC03_012609 [Tulasnella sp. 419]|nr:hypothetical protein FRC03_012609 [Tulasnella sp. 419]
MLDGHPSSFAEIKLRLLPVLHEEANLVKKLVGNDVAFTVKSYDEATPKEPAVRSGTAWKRAFEKANGRPSSPATVEGIDFDDRADPGVILHACREEMMALWQNERVHEILKRRRVNLEDSGFFLDQLDRITSRRFIPTDDDILRTRLKTVGAAEHNFTINTGPEKGIDWKIYDVGGSRTQRQTWAPFFDDVNAILFLAPISAFDQVLTEDRRVNRLEDSLTLWTELCRNKILANVPLILFLNKCDLLQLKLESGVIVKKYVTSYADRPNDFPNVSHYFRAKFEAVKRHHSPPEREVFIHLTSMTDSKAMYAVIGSVVR